MNPQIGGEGHRALAQFTADQAETHGLLLGTTKTVPFIKVQMAATASDMIGDEPGNRGNVCVPGPPGLTGMTVEARALQDGLNLGRNIELRLKAALGNDRWVGTVGAKKLQDSEN